MMDRHGKGGTVLQLRPLIESAMRMQLPNRVVKEWYCPIDSRRVDNEKEETFLAFLAVSFGHHSALSVDRCCDVDRK